MSNDAFITITGNVGGDPELRFLPTGVAVATFSVAHTPRHFKGGEWEDSTTTWYRVNVWRGLAEALVEEVGKGTRVIVHGKLQGRTWQTEDGEERVSWEIDADTVGLAIRALKIETPEARPAHRGASPTGRKPTTAKDSRPPVKRAPAKRAPRPVQEVEYDEPEF